MSRIRLVYLSTVCYGTYETNVKKNCTEAMNWYRLNELKKWLIQKILLLDWPTCNSLASITKPANLLPSINVSARPRQGAVGREGGQWLAADHDGRPLALQLDLAQETRDLGRVHRATLRTRVHHQLKMVWFVKTWKIYWDGISLLSIISEKKATL